MTKAEATALFGRQKDLCAALGICRKTFWNWPDPLPQERVDRIVGAHLRISEGHDKKLMYVVGG